MEWLAEQPNGQTGGEPRLLTVNGRSSIPSEKIDRTSIQNTIREGEDSLIGDLSLSLSLSLSPPVLFSFSLSSFPRVFLTHALYRGFLRASELISARPPMSEQNNEHCIMPSRAPVALPSPMRSLP